MQTETLLVKSELKEKLKGSSSLTYVKVIPSSPFVPPKISLGKPTGSGDYSTPGLTGDPCLNKGSKYHKVLPSLVKRW